MSDLSKVPEGDTWGTKIDTVFSELSLNVKETKQRLTVLLPIGCTGCSLNATESEHESGV